MRRHTSIRDVLAPAFVGILLGALVTMIAADDATDARATIDRLRTIATARETTPDARRDATRDLLDARRTLLRDAPDDPDAPLLALDQAFDLYAIEMELDASRFWTQYGVPTADQRARTLAATREMSMWADRAASGLDARIANLEAAIRAGDGDVAAQRARHERLQVERTTRLPFVRGLAALFGALFDDDLTPTDRRRRLDDAAGILGDLAATLDGPARRAARLGAGSALAELGRFEEADAHFRAVAEAEAPTRDRLEARLGAVRNREVRGGPSSGLAGLADVRARYADSHDALALLALADRDAMLRRRLDGSDGSWIEPWVALLDGPIARHDVALRAALRRRILDAAPDTTVTAATPTLVRIAVAEQQSDEAALRTIIAMSGASDEHRADALLALARVLDAADRGDDAASTRLTLVRDHPDHPESPLAAHRCTEHWAARLAADPTDVRIRASYDDVIDEMARAFGDQRWLDAWLMHAATLAADRDDWARVRALLDALPRQSKDWPAACVLLADARLATTTDRETLRSIITWIDGVLDVMPRWHDESTTRASRGGLAVIRAEVELAMDEPARALSTLDGIDPAVLADETTQARLIRVRFASLLALDRADAAATVIRELLVRAPGRVDAVVPAMMDAARRRVDAFLARGDEAAAGALAARELLPLAAVLDEASGADASMTVMRRLAIADAYRLAGRPREALAIYDELDRAHPDRAEILLGRAECLVAMDDGLRDAMLIYRRLGASGPGAGASYWLAQLRMLELIERSGRNREQILPRLARLRAESPELGGPRFRARFEALRRRQESAP